MDLDLAEQLRGWRPEPQVDQDRLSVEQARGLAQALGMPDIPAEEGLLPALWHWVYFRRWPRPDELGPDGHPRSDGLQPPIPGRRRMWAGGRVEQRHPLALGAEARRAVEVTEVRSVSGRSGDLVFVTTRAEITQHGRLCVVDEVDVVYRMGERPGNDRPGNDRPRNDRPRDGSETAGTSSRNTSVDPVLLFRFSALTGNSHRIHYDRPYATEEEGYPGLVVHGPLLALLMVGHARASTTATVRGVDYRFRRPVFADERFALEAVEDPGEVRAVTVRITSARDAEHARAKVTFG